jgi:transaldolase
MNPVKALQDHGQAVWLDFFSRGFIAKGELKKLVDEDGLRGVTSSPSIFEKATTRLRKRFFPRCAKASTSTSNQRRE